MKSSSVDGFWVLFFIVFFIVFFPLSLVAVISGGVIAFSMNVMEKESKKARNNHGK